MSGTGAGTLWWQGPSMIGLRAMKEEATERAALLDTVRSAR